MQEKKPQTLFEYIQSLQLIGDSDLDQAVQFSTEKKISLSDALVELDLIDPTALGKVVADYYHLPFAELSQVSIPLDVLNIVPQHIAEAEFVVAFRKTKTALDVAIAEPKQIQLFHFLGKKTGLVVRLFLASKPDLMNALTGYQNTVQESFEEMMSGQIQKVDTSKSDDPPIIEIVNSLIDQAYKRRASDIHIEPTEKNALVRFRVDGVLHDVLSLPLTVYRQIVTRLKVMAGLRTDEQHAAQDGKIEVPLAEESLDIRLSIVPIINGENVVMRLLSESSRQFSLQSLGLADRDLVLIKDAYQKPHGMILVTGPTGSGKTTTMYAILKLVNHPHVNIMTIEDPVEYTISRVQQIQVNTKTNLTFAAGLRSIVRQDPDIILVGEIRDEETAGIAVNAAMTGHLLLSTLHTNDAATTLPRLIDMGVEPYLIASTVNVIVAQRLVRKICQACRVSREPNEQEVVALQKHMGHAGIINRLYQGKGCSVCSQTGYVGRSGVFEVMVINDKIRAAIVAKQDAGMIEKIAREEGMISLVEDGLQKVKQGITTLEEVLRVANE